MSTNSSRGKRTGCRLHTLHEATAPVVIGGVCGKLSRELRGGRCGADQGERCLGGPLGSTLQPERWRGSLTAGKQERSSLEPHAVWLLDLTAAEPDLTLEAIVSGCWQVLG